MPDDLNALDEFAALEALADADAKLLAVPESSDLARLLVARKVAIGTRLLAVRAEQEAAGTKVAGDYRVRQPALDVSIPEPPTPTFELPEAFAGHEAAIAHAESVAQREGFDGLPSVLMMLSHTATHAPHELTPTGLDAKAQTQRAEAAQAAIRARHGDEEGQRIIDGAVAAVRTLGLQGVVRALRQTDRVDLIEHLGQRWLARRSA